jgi:hypothetical protein
MKISYLLFFTLSLLILLIPMLYSESVPIDDYNEFLKKYGYLEDYYKRWQNFVPERDYPDDKEVNYYLKLEKEGKLPKNYTIYHNDNDALPVYREFLTSQPKSLKDIYEDLKIYHPAILSETYDVVPESDDFAKYISIPKIDYLLWMLKELSKTHPRYQTPYELYVMGDWMIRRSICFPKEIEYYRKNVLPIFRGMVLSGSFNTYILKVLYLFGDKDILPVAFEAAKSSGIAITMWGREYLSFKRKIRVTEEPLEFKPYIINLLSNENPINEGSQYDSVLWLYRAGELPDHRDLLIRILDKGWFGIHGNDPGRYLDFLWDIKDKRIYEYLKKNINNPNLLTSERSKIIDYLKAYEKNEK